MDNEIEKRRVLGGAFIIIIGILFFLRQAGIAVFPYWLFTWPMILIIAGLFVGIRHNFRGGGWLVMIIIGTFFLLDDVLDMYSLHQYLVPAILVAVGIMIILRPRSPRMSGIGGHRCSRMGGRRASFTDSNAGTGTADNNPGADDASERLNATAIFGAVKKNILSKNFKGGDATSIFGGSEIDLSRADINGTVVIDVTAILGGVKLIVPSHWVVKQDITAIFGGVDDKRYMDSAITVESKVLVLQGTAFMGGIEISSYR